MGPIINQNNEKVVPLSSKEMEDSYLKPYTLSQKGTLYTGKNVDVENVTDTAVLQTLVDETTRIYGRDVNSGASDKKQTMEEDVVEPKHLKFQETTPVIPTEVGNEIVANGKKVDSTDSLEIDIKRINSEHECLELVEAKPIIPILVQEKADAETKKDLAEIFEQKTTLTTEPQAMSFISDEEIENYREVGKMRLLAKDDVHQMIIESALLENEVMDSSVVDKGLGIHSAQEKDLNPRTFGKTENNSFDN